MVLEARYLARSFAETSSLINMPKNGPLILVSNHAFSARQLPIILEVSSIRSDLHVISNKTFIPFLSKLKVNSIGVQSSQHTYNGKLLEEIWARIIGNKKTIDSLNENDSVIERALKVLNNSGSIWITPAGARDDGFIRRWRNGIGEIIKRKPNAHIGLIFIPETILKKAKYLITLNLQDLKTKYKAENTHEITRALQAEYQNQVSSSF